MTRRLSQRIRAAEGAAKVALEKQREELRAKMRPYNRTKPHTHGWVWLYLRSAQAAGAPR